MRIIRQGENVPYEKTAVALGNFDGLHRAHMTIISRCRRYAAEHGIKCGVLLFTEHTKNRVSGGAVKIITTEKQKLELLKRAGMDFVYMRDFDEEFMHMAPDEFASQLKDELHTEAVCIGYDYRFGYRAAGDASMLDMLGKRYGFETIVTDEIDIDGSAVKSTLIRDLIASGDVERAERLLGRPVRLEGIVEKGLQNGRKMGIPTANISYEEVFAIPAHGVYAGYTEVHGKRYKSVINVGSNPTFGAQRVTVESHILGFDEDIYGEEISAEFIKRLRDDKKFSGTDELIKQIKSDIARAGKELDHMFTSIILAAGMGTRMKSDKPKVIHKVCGKELVNWVADASYGAGADDVVAVIGHKAEIVRPLIAADIKTVLQTEQLGTGHAVLQAKEYIDAAKGCVVILNGDTPLITSDMIKKAVDHHMESGNSATVITAVMDDPTGYGRIVRAEDGSVVGIVEHKDATEEQRLIDEINSGMYVFDSGALSYALSKLTPNNAQGEYYLTDTIGILRDDKKRVGGYRIEDNDEIRGINDRVQLSEAEAIMRRRINERHMRSGVTMISPETVFIGCDVEIGNDTVIAANVTLEGKTKIGSGCMIDMGTKITDSVIGDSVTVTSSVILESEIESGTSVGPFAYVRPGCRVGKCAKVGDFVEIKNSNIGDGTKISHLTYIGDSDVGKNVNFGCGTVTCNYDGKDKFRSTIGDNVFIGCNTNLVSPVTLGDGSYIAAGSTITDDVPDKNLAIARARQVNKDNWTGNKYDS